MKETVNRLGDNANYLSPTASMEQPQPRADIPPPPLPHRRPRVRVREVSSRFMSPLVPSSTIQIPTATPASECQRSKSVEKRRQQQEQEPLSTSRTDENIPETTRSLDGTSLLVALGSHNHSSKAGGGTGASMSTAHRKNQQRAKLYKENSEGAKAVLQHHPSSRPDTPIVGATDRIVPSRYRLTTQGSHRPIATNLNIGGAAVTAAAKLLQDATSSTVLLKSCTTRDESSDDRTTLSQRELPKISRSNDDSSDLRSTTRQGGSCPSSPVCISSNKTRTLTDLRSSLPEVDMLPTLSSRWPAERSSNYFHTGEISNSKLTSSPCSRSLNLPMSSAENSCSTSSWHFHRASDLTAASTPSKPSAKYLMGNICLPPHPSCLKLGADARKGRKLFINQEDVHSLKLLHNHYLQWRFTNAKAEASMRAQRMGTEKQLKSLGSKLSEMHDELKSKRIELAHMQRIKTLSEIVESQMPYLDQWSAMEKNYSGSLSGVIEALLNLSLRLPISGEIKIDVIGLGETFDSALKMMELITLRIKSFMVKAEETGSLISDLARVVGGEKALIEECGVSLFKAYASQVEECSLRGHLFQVRRSNQYQSQQEQNFSSQEVTC